MTCVGIATIAAAVGAGGLGELIFRGVASVDNRLVLAGAVPAAMLALIADAVISALWLRHAVFANGLFVSAGVIAYIIAWIVMPEEPMQVAVVPAPPQQVTNP